MSDEKQQYYLNHLNEQLSLLIDCCHSYDQGNFSQAKMMSTIIRTIVKDVQSKKSKTISLLKSLNVKDNMKFYNTGYEAIDPSLLINLVGIVSVPSKAPISKNLEHIYLPLLNSSNLIDCRWLNFSDWWDSKVIVSKAHDREIVFTRSKICLTMAEQDGGAHIDSFENVDKDYRDIVQSIANIFVNIDSNGIEAPILYLHYALVRQISHELIISIKKQFNLPYEYKPTNKFNLRDVPENQIKQFGVFAEDGKHLSIRTQTPYKCSGFSSFKTPPNAAYVKIQF